MSKKLLALSLLLFIEFLEKIFPVDENVKEKSGEVSKSGDAGPVPTSVQTTVFISADLFEDNMCESDVIPASFISPHDCFGDGSSKAVLRQISKIIKTIEVAKANARHEFEEDEE